MKKEDNDFVTYSAYVYDKETKKTDFVLKSPITLRKEGYIFQKIITSKQDTAFSKAGHESRKSTLNCCVMEDEDCEDSLLDDNIKFELSPAVMKTLKEWNNLELVTNEDGSEKIYNDGIQEYDKCTIKTIAYKLVNNGKFKDLKGGVKAITLIPNSQTVQGQKRNYVNVNIVFEELEETTNTKEVKTDVSDVSDVSEISDEELAEELL